MAKKLKDKSYDVTVIRTSYSSRVITVTASNDGEAKNKALDEAGDYEFSEKSADYEADGATENKAPKPFNFNKLVKEMDKRNSEAGMASDLNDVFNELVEKHGENFKIQIKNAVQDFYDEFLD